jgi:hypothetical protein
LSRFGPLTVLAKTGRKLPAVINPPSEGFVPGEPPAYCILPN